MVGRYNNPNKRKKPTRLVNPKKKRNAISRKRIDKTPYPKRSFYDDEYEKLDNLIEEIQQCESIFVSLE